MAGKWRKVRTQVELDKVLADGDYAELEGTGWFEQRSGVSASGSASVSASGSASVSASGSASVSASGSASVSAYGSASVRASGSASVRAYGSASVSASKYVAVHRLSMRSTIDGGVVITPPDLTDAKSWCDYYGITVSRGFAVLYKGVNAEFISDHGTSYAPGSKPAAPDWNDRNECGGGLHFSPSPHLTRVYCDPARFVAVKVKVSELVPIGTEGSSDKVKAPRCAVLYECDEDGNEIRSDQASGA